MNTPKDTAIDMAHSKLYVVDGLNNRILRYSYPITGNLPTAELVFGQPDFTSFASGTTQNTLSDPRGIDVDDTGRLWVADRSNSRVIWFDNAYAIASNQPNANGVLGQPDFTSSAATTTQNGMNSSYDVVLSDDGDLYVADESNHRVLRFDGAAQKANGANADGVLGQPDFTSNALATTQSGMSRPRGVALVDDSLFVGDRSNHRVLRFDNAAQKANGADADGVLGQPDFTSNTSAITQKGMDYPARVTVDAAQRLYVSQGFDADRVTIYVHPVSKANGGPADYVLGQSDFVSGGSGLAQNRLSMDSSGGGMSIDSVNNYLVVSDDNNNRVMIFQSNEPLVYPSLLIDKTGPDNVRAQYPVTYTLTVTNSGNVTATHVVITDVVPVGATYVSGGTLMPGDVMSWTIDSLAGDGGAVQSAQVQFVVTTTQVITNNDYRVSSGQGVEYASAAGSQSVVTGVTGWTSYMPIIFKNAPPE